MIRLFGYTFLTVTALSYVAAILLGIRAGLGLRAQLGNRYSTAKEKMGLFMHVLVPTANWPSYVVESDIKTLQKFRRRMWGAAGVAGIPLILLGLAWTAVCLWSIAD